MEVNYRDFMEALIQHGQGRTFFLFFLVVGTVLSSYQKVSAQKCFMVSLDLCGGPERMRQVLGVSLAASGSDNSPGRGRVFVIKQQHFVLNVLTIVCITELHILVYPPHLFTATVNLVNKSEANYSSSVNTEVNTEDLELDATHAAWHCEGSCSLVLNPGGGGRGEAPDWLLRVSPLLKTVMASQHQAWLSSGVL